MIDLPLEFHVSDLEFLLLLLQFQLVFLLLDSAVFGRFVVLLAFLVIIRVVAAAAAAAAGRGQL